MRPEIDAPALLDRLGISYRRRGRALLAPCPLPGHTEKEPSWSMRDEPGEEKHGAHWCFGCGRGGGPADLVAAVLGVDLADARAWIRSGACYRESDLPAQIIISVKRAKPAFVLPEGVAYAPLGAWPTPARLYLQKRRVDPAQAARWGLGYAVDGRLAMRVVIPVRDGGGVVRSFVARSFVARSGGREAKRYLEPREEDGADHAAILGEHLWPRPELRRVALVGEGWFDGAALERASGGLPVAVLHGSPHPGQGGWDAVIGKLASFPLLVAAVDPNDAGERLLSSLTGALGRYSKILPLRCGELDASGYAEQRGDAALGRALAEAMGADLAQVA